MPISQSCLHPQANISIQVDPQIFLYFRSPKQGKFTWGCSIFFMGQSPKPG
ncbi:hypothetical protein M6B38_390745 [Iris pallida]|uniref:Uncharacterized protein n=1 Tax=Iris pallida TaxID=29817 RepID=A0AAX6FZ28_IRIPA|nr:hypothetical protein M6B38_390745 [Iris pallida]